MKKFNLKTKKQLNYDKSYSPQVLPLNSALPLTKNRTVNQTPKNHSGCANSGMPIFRKNCYHRGGLLSRGGSRNFLFPETAISLD